LSALQGEFLLQKTKHAYRTELDVRGSVRHSTIHEENPTRCNNVSTFLLIPYLSEAQHVSGDTLPFIRGLKLHWQPLVFYT
jgi:hypothetical protein